MRPPAEGEAAWHLAAHEFTLAPARRLTAKFGST